MQKTGSSTLTLGLALSACLAAAACGAPEMSDADPSSTPTPSSSPTPTPEASDHITADTTWSGQVALAATTTVDAGVTLTVSPGTTVNVASGAKLRVEGSIVAEPGGATVFQGDAGANWAGIVVAPGGSADLREVTFTDTTTAFTTEAGAALSTLVEVTLGGGVPMRLAADTKVCRLSLLPGAGSVYVQGGTATFVDSDLQGGGGDTLVFSAGNLVVEHSLLAEESHCLIHGGGTSATLDVNKSVFVNADYAFMLSNLTSATVRNSKIELGTMTGSDSGISTSSATVDAQENWWGGAAGFTGTVPDGWDVSNPVTAIDDARVADAGPRAVGQGCESDPAF